MWIAFPAARISSEEPRSSSRVAQLRSSVTCARSMPAVSTLRALDSNTPAAPGGAAETWESERTIKGQTSVCPDSLSSVAPVEIARAAPEAVLVLRHRRSCLLGPGLQRDLGLDGLGDDRVDRRLRAVHRLFETGLLLGLEERVVLERIVVVVAGK